MKKRLRRPGRLPLPHRPLEWGLAIVAVALVALAVTSLGNGSPSSSAATRRTAAVGKGVVQSTVSGNGTLEPKQKVELSFGAAGEVTAIDVKAGQKAKKGQVLAEVDSSSARASLASAEAHLIEAEEAVETAAEAEGEDAAYEGGARSVFVGLVSEDGTAAPGKEEEKPKKEEQPEEEKEPVEKEETSAPTESSGGGDETGGGETGASAGASISLPTAEANLREAELSVKSARQEVRETTLRAPISGTVTSISGQVGEEATGSGSAFMVLAQLHRLKMEVSFSESDIGKVRKGQTATVAIDSMEGTELAGRVTKVGLLPSEGSSSVVEYPATILVTQSAKGLRAGMSASAEVVVEQVKDAITVPSEAISSAAGGKTVTIEEDGKEVTKSIATGLVGDETTQVVGGLKAGQTLVLPEASVAAGGIGGEAGGTESGGFPGGGGSFPVISGGGGGFSPPSGGFPGRAP